MIFPAEIGLPGRPRNVIKFFETNALIDDLAFRQILLHPLVKNRKIVAVSIVGAFRKGKSFLLDYFLRYLYYNVSRWQVEKKSEKMRLHPQNPYMAKIIFIFEIFHISSTPVPP